MKKFLVALLCLAPYLLFAKAQKDGWAEYAGNGWNTVHFLGAGMSVWVSDRYLFQYSEHPRLYSFLVGITPTFCKEIGDEVYSRQFPKTEHWAWDCRGGDLRDIGVAVLGAGLTALMLPSHDWQNLKRSEERFNRALEKLRQEKAEILKLRKELKSLMRKRERERERQPLLSGS